MQTSSLLQYIKSWLRVLFSVKKETNRELNSSETFITQKKEYPYSGSHLDLDDFNGILYNAGFSFQVESYNKKSKEMLIKGSFDLSYYTQLHFTFLNVEFTTLEENEI